MLGFDATAGGGVDGRSLIIIVKWCIEEFSMSYRLDFADSRQVSVLFLLKACSGSKSDLEESCSYVSSTNDILRL